MLLVFALGFLVYQKVERHQRQLTQAAIAPREVDAAPTTDRQPVAASATDAAPADFGSTTEMAITDPLTVATAAEPSPFAAAAELPTENYPESAADSAPVFAFSEPMEEPTDQATDQLTDAAEPAVGMSVAEFPAEPDIDFPPESNAEPAADAPELLVMNEDDATALAVSESDTSSAFAAPEALPSADPAQSPLELSAESDSPATNFLDTPPLLLAAADPEQGDPAEGTLRTEPEAVELSAPGQPEGLPASKSADSPTAPQLPEFAFPPDAADVPADGEQMSKSAAFPAEAADSPEPAPLLALAEPQFSPGSTGPAGLVPPSEAFRAVTRPGASGARASRQGDSGSAGSTGADRDGRFSLAAFNTRNTAVQPGTDDGDKHPSVIVRNGENYSKISRRVYGTTRYFAALAVFNQHRIPNPDAMRPGMIVLTPDARVLEERYPQLFPDRQPKVEQSAGFLLLDDGSPAYRVGARETLSEISERFLGRSARWVEIYQLNRSVLSDPNILKPGLVLALPDDATEVQLVP